MRVLSGAEMQACDRLTVERFGIPSFELMRTASTAVATFARQQFPQAWRVTVVCGGGNNGGDGLLAARHLAAAGLEVTTLLLGSPDRLKGDAAKAWRELNSLEDESAHSLVQVIEREADLERHRAALDADLILDAIVGNGFKPPLKGLPLAALEWLRAGTAPVLAVDLPSGWPADETAATITGPVCPADAVITFTAPKPAHVFGQLTRRWNQPVAVAPIGSPEEAMLSELKLHWAGSALALVQAPRPAAANKGNYGHVLVIGGTLGSAGGKTGAPAIASLGALRAGAGLVTAAVPAPVLPLAAAIAPELMTWPLAASAEGAIAAQNCNAEFIKALTAGKTVLAIGPGMGQGDGAAEFVTALLAAAKAPAVLDADALNILAARPELLAQLSASAKAGRVLVFTPHPGEMARLAGMTAAGVQADRLGVARSFAQRYGVTLVLKGARTLIAHPDGSVAVNTTGNPGMAKGGSGDLLTGIIAGLLAQHPEEPGRAVEAAVYLHGLAADMALKHADEHTLLATDSIPELPQAFRFSSTGPNGYLWLQGTPAESLPAEASCEAAE